jgi:hypothetical protein
MGIEGLPDDVSDFERTMFLASPERIMMFWDFLRRISEFNGLRVKLLQASKDSNFWEIADNFGFANWNDHRDLGISKLPITINNYLDSLDSHKKISFSRNEIEEVKKALEATFTFELEESEGIISTTVRKAKDLVR